MKEYTIKYPLPAPSPCMGRETMRDVREHVKKTNNNF